MIRPFPTVRADGAQAIGAVAEQRSWIPGSALDYSVSAGIAHGHASNGCTCKDALKEYENAANRDCRHR